MGTSDSMTSGKAKLGLVISCLGIFMVNLDMTIVNVAMPVMAGVFSAHTSTLSLVVLAYLISETALLLPFGFLGDLWGIKRIFIVGFVFFTAASLLCGLAPSLNWLIIFRLLQGAGGAMMFSVVIALLSSCMPPAQRMRAYGVCNNVRGSGGRCRPDDWRLACRLVQLASDFPD